MITLPHDDKARMELLKALSGLERSPDGKALIAWLTAALQERDEKNRQDIEEGRGQGCALTLAAILEAIAQSDDNLDGLRRELAS